MSMDYRIVIVDDDSLSLENAKELLVQQGMQVSCLRSGHDLLKFLEKDNFPDLILLNVMMPEMDGFETFRAVRQFEQEAGRKRTPIIFLTGESDTETERRGLNEGASDFIYKPFNKDIFINRIRNTITSNKMIESLTEEASLDKLTGFLNKSSGTEQISKLCESRTGALVILDLDNFKLVNDLYGHDMGDRILIAFADIIRLNTRAGDLVCRIGGDEFMAFFGNVTEESAVAALAHRLNEQLMQEAQRLMGEDFGIPIGISVGGVMVPLYGTDYKELFLMADHALYYVKENGKHGCAMHHDSDDDPGEECDLEWELARITKIVEERNDMGGGLLLGQDFFSSIYRYMSRFHKRYGGNVTKLLFVLTGKKGDRSEMKEAMALFIRLLQKSLRKSDILLQSKPNQVFLLLAEASEEGAMVVVNRTLKDWENTEYHEKVKVSYVMKGMQ